MSNPLHDPSENHADVHHTPLTKFTSLWGAHGCAAVRLLDRTLRSTLGIVEFCGSEACILRIALRRDEMDIDLPDGTQIRRSDELVELHFWNEHLPRLRDCGSPFGRAVRFRSQMHLSLKPPRRSCGPRPSTPEHQGIRCEYGTSHRRKVAEVRNGGRKLRIPRHQTTPHFAATITRCARERAHSRPGVGLSSGQTKGKAGFAGSRTLVDSPERPRAPMRGLASAKSLRSVPARDFWRGITFM